ncbi:MAG: hypothetical protein ACLP1X_27095 [Polyangiaceae bacterium]
MTKRELENLKSVVKLANDASKVKLRQSAEAAWLLGLGLGLQEGRGPLRPLGVRIAKIASRLAKLDGYRSADIKKLRKIATKERSA